MADKFADEKFVGIVIEQARGWITHSRESNSVHVDVPLGALETLVEEVARLRSLLNTPEVEEFDKAVPLEAAHQVNRWGAPHDAGKQPEDWFWLIGYLAGKALSAHKAGDLVKAKHHTISSAAALRNWHAHIRSGSSVMRPGIEEPKS